MAAARSPQTRLAEASLRLLSKNAWSDLSLAAVAKAAKIPFADLAALAPAKPALIGLVLRRLGDDVARTHKPDRNAAGARDRLFDVGMAWFDALGRHKPAVRSLYDGLKVDPLTLLAARGTFVEAAEWLMTLAEADKGPALTLRAAGFALALGRAIGVWLDDDADLTKTMARLDGDLRRGESLLGRA